MLKVVNVSQTTKKMADILLRLNLKSVINANVSHFLGAEVHLSDAEELKAVGNCKVTLIGSGRKQAQRIETTIDGVVLYALVPLEKFTAK